MVETKAVKNTVGDFNREKGEEMKRYRGDRTQAGAEVWVDDKPLPNRTDLRKISRDGLFEWSYVGNEPAQLALAILAEHLDNDEKAVTLYPTFMEKVVANFDNEWEMNSTNIETALANISEQ